MNNNLSPYSHISWEGGIYKKGLKPNTNKRFRYKNKRNFNNFYSILQNKKSRLDSHQDG